MFFGSSSELSLLMGEMRVRKREKRGRDCSLVSRKTDDGAHEYNVRVVKERRERDHVIGEVLSFTLPPKKEEKNSLEYIVESFHTVERLLSGEKRDWRERRRGFAEWEKLAELFPHSKEMMAYRKKEMVRAMRRIHILTAFNNTITQMNDKVRISEEE